MPTLDELLASSRHVVSYGAGILTAFGLTKTLNPDVLITSFDHIFNGIKEISIGVGPLVAVGMGWWATHKSSPTAQIAAVAEIAKDPASPVKGIVTSNSAEGVALANSIPGTTVVPAGTAQATALAKTGT